MLDLDSSLQYIDELEPYSYRKETDIILNIPITEFKKKKINNGRIKRSLGKAGFIFQYQSDLFQKRSQSQPLVSLLNLHTFLTSRPIKSRG